MSWGELNCDHFKNSTCPTTPTTEGCNWKCDFFENKEAKKLIDSTCEAGISGAKAGKALKESLVDFSDRIVLDTSNMSREQYAKLMAEGYSEVPSSRDDEAKLHADRHKKDVEQGMKKFADKFVQNLSTKKKQKDNKKDKNRAKTKQQKKSRKNNRKG